MTKCFHYKFKCSNRQYRFIILPESNHLQEFNFILHENTHQLDNMAAYKSANDYNH